MQDFEALDAQIRKSVTEVHVRCSRLDRVKMPYLPLRLPKIHRATARYGGPTGPVYKRWHTWGADLYGAYDTREAVKPELLWSEAGPVDMRCNATMLSAWHLRGRYLPKPLTLGDRVFLFGSIALLVILGAVLLVPAGRSPAGTIRSFIERFHAARQPAKASRSPRSAALQLQRA